MYSNHYILPVAAAIVCCVSATPSHAEDIKTCVSPTMLGAVEKLNKALDKITDKASLDKALPEVEQAAKTYAEVTKKMMTATPPASPEEAQEVASMQQKSQEIMGKFQANMMRLQQAQLMTPELAAAFAKMAPQAPAN